MSQSLIDFEPQPRKRRKGAPCQTCPTCGVKLVEYPRRISAGLANALLAMYAAVGTNPFQPYHANLAFSQKTTFNLMRHWGLAEKVPEQLGFWRVTPHGEAWIKGRIKVRGIAWTYRGSLVRFDGPEVGVEDALPGEYWTRDDYVRFRDNRD